ncbi:MAG: VOC family protein [Gemmatimonadaceae bacterium]
MDPTIRSLHHVTATVAGAQDDVDFHVGVLGLRLVKKTVNFDNPGVYHFYYGDERGSPGTLMTTFPYADKGVRQGLKGVGQITVTSFSVPEGSLGFWRQRLAALGVPHHDDPTAFGEEAIAFTDRSGLGVRLVASAADARAPWTADGIGEAEAIRGIHGVSLLVRDPLLTVALVAALLDGAVVGEAEGVTRMGIGGGLPGHLLELVGARGEGQAVNGLGTVHHVAFAAADGEGQLRVREELVRRGIQVTPVLDRQYFQSIYFREPNGVLFEVATMLPGFAVDEEPAGLGRALRLPPWEEARRAEIESSLPPLSC